MSGWSLKLNLMFTKLLMHSVNISLSFAPLYCVQTQSKENFSPCVTHPNLTVRLFVESLLIRPKQPMKVPTAQITMDALTVCVGVCLGVCLSSAQPLTELLT